MLSHSQPSPSDGPKRHRRQQLQKVLIGTFGFTYPLITRSALRIVHCEPSLGESSVSIWHGDVSTQCYSGWHLVAVVPAWIVLGLFSFSGPALLAYALFRRRDHLWDQSTEQAAPSGSASNTASKGTFAGSNPLRVIDVSRPGSLNVGSEVAVLGGSGSDKQRLSEVSTTSGTWY